MNTNHFPIFIVRLFSLYCFLQGALNIFMSTIALSQNGTEKIFHNSYYILFFAPAVFWFVATALFWILAPYLAEKAYPEKEHTDSTPTTFNVTIHDLYELAFCALGILCLILSIPQMANSIYYSFLNSELDQASRALQNSSIISVITILFSLSLVFGRRKIVQTLL